MRFLITFAAALAAVCAYAQELPCDKELVKGTLDNGMTYYIRHNARPAGTADFYIIHNVGALQEEPRQDGLAHFLEHLAFNGTKHYPEKGILDFLGREGVRFGYNVNAYTSRTETVYHMDKVPLVRDSFVDSVLMVLHDWSCDITCGERAIEEERGVVLEEWRRRSDSKTRVFNMQNKLTYQGSPVGEKTVIGSMDVVMHCEPKDILDFYHKWYRPDLQALVIVGDFDAPAMEKKVRALFSDIPVQENPAPKAVFPIEPLDGTVYENMVDSLATFLSLKVFCRQPYPAESERNTEGFYKDMYLRQIVASVLSARMREQLKDPSNPVKSGVLVPYSVGNDFYVSLFTILAKKGEDPSVMLDFYADNVNSLVRYGMTREEFEVARNAVFKKQELNREIVPSVVSSSSLAGIYVSDFLGNSGTAFPSDLQKAQIRIMNSLTLDEANAFACKVLRESDRIVSFYVNPDELSSIPATEQIKERLAKADARDPGQLAVSVQQVDLDVDPAPGKVMKVRGSKKAGTEEWTLSNGARVYWTPTDPVKTAINLSMLMYFDTGRRVFPADSIAVYKLAEEYMSSRLGFRGADKDRLDKDPRNTGIITLTRFSSRQATMSLSIPTDKMEQGFKNIHLLLTEPSFGKQSDMLLFKRAHMESLAKEEKPATLFNREYMDLYYGNDPWLVDADTNDVKALGMEQVREAFSRQFRDFGNMQVFICSDAPRQEIMALVEKYIASLSEPYPYKKSKVKPLAPAFRGNRELIREFKAEQEARSRVSYELVSPLKPTLANKCALEAIDYILSARYLTKIREERGGTYTIRFSSGMNAVNKGLTESIVQFQTRPEMTDMLIGDTRDIFATFCKDGPSGAELAEAVAYLREAYREGQDRKSQAVIIKNREIAEIIRDNAPDGDYEAALDKLTTSGLRKVARKLDSGNKLLTVFTEK